MKFDSKLDKLALSSAIYGGTRNVAHRTQQAVAKVPEITAYFWIIKVLTTGMGETTSDFLVQHMNPIIAVVLGFIGLVTALTLQFSVRRYIPWIYWLTVVMVAIFGTMAADVLHIGLGIPYLVTTIFFLLALAVIFIAWYASEKTLSIHSINTRRREVFYWATVLATFALGTAAGDMTATTLHLGYFSSGIMFAILIAIVAIAHYITKTILGAEHRRLSSNAVLAFWLAYILTRPLGASVADWAGVSQARGGLNLGDGPVSFVLLIIIICFISYLTVSRKDIKS
jgi:uncharacterized membrane-anchored protein